MYLLHLGWVIKHLFHDCLVNIQNHSPSVPWMAQCTVALTSGNSALGPPRQLGASFDYSPNNHEITVYYCIYSAWKKHIYVKKHEYPYIKLELSKNEPPYDKTNKVSMHPAKMQISLGIHPVWSESSMCSQWVAKDPSFLHADSKDSDQTLLVLSCRSSDVEQAKMNQQNGSRLSNRKG